MGALTDKAALVTGGGSGIGAATARLLAAEGAAVGVVDVKPERAEEVAGQIAEAGGRGLALPADVTSDEQVAGAVEGLVGEFGRLDAVFSNAGINGVFAPIDDLTLDEWKRTLAVNLDGAFLVVHHSVPHLKERGGSIIFNASINGPRCYRLWGGTAYSTTKAGLVAMARMLALELARWSIRVNTVCPGGVPDTRLDENTTRRNRESIGPDGRDAKMPGIGACRPEDVGQAVLFLASDAAAKISGTEIYVDTGASLLY